MAFRDRSEELVFRYWFEPEFVGEQWGIGVHDLDGNGYLDFYANHHGQQSGEIIMNFLSGEPTNIDYEIAGRPARRHVLRRRSGRRRGPAAGPGRAARRGDGRGRPEPVQQGPAERRRRSERAQQRRGLRARICARPQADPDARQLRRRSRGLCRRLQQPAGRNVSGAVLRPGRAGPTIRSPRRGLGRDRERRAFRDRPLRRRRSTSTISSGSCASTRTGARAFAMSSC